MMGVDILEGRGLERKGELERTGMERNALEAHWTGLAIKGLSIFSNFACGSAGYPGGKLEWKEGLEGRAGRKGWRL
jgi:hypothetical protein